jgi:hypothetical protein
MVKEKEPGTEELADEFSTILRDHCLQYSAVQLAQVVSIAFDRTFTTGTTESSLAKALARGISVREKMASEEGGSLSTEETARLLGVTKQSILNMYHAGKLLAWRSERQSALRFPAWQLEGGRRLPGLDKAIAELNKNSALDDWAKIGFFLQSHSVSNDRRPLDLLREGDLETVLLAAQAYAA